MRGIWYDPRANFNISSGLYLNPCERLRFVQEKGLFYVRGWLQHFIMSLTYTEVPVRIEKNIKRFWSHLSFKTATFSLLTVIHSSVSHSTEKYRLKYGDIILLILKKICEIITSPLGTCVGAACTSLLVWPRFLCAIAMSIWTWLLPTIFQSTKWRFYVRRLSVS